MNGTAPKSDRQHYNTSMSDTDPLFDGAQPIDDETTVTETVVFDDDTVLLGTDPFRPIDVMKVPDDARTVDSAVEQH